MNSFHVVLSANQAWNIYNFRCGLVTSLLGKGAKVTILAPLDSSSEKLKELGCDVIDLDVASQGVNPLADILLIWRYMRMLRRIKPDLLINYTIKPNIYGSLSAYLVGVRSLAVTTGLGYTFINDNIVTRVANILYKVALKFPAQVWFLNDDDQRVFVERGLVDPKKTRILDGEGIDTEFFAPRAKASTDKQFRFLLIARMLWDKGISEYVDAARIVKTIYPNAQFQLLGAVGVDNPSAASHEQIAAWHNAGIVEYLGTSTDVRSVIADADCVVLPSYREGVPRTLMEAAAMAKPLIATDVPGCREVVLDGRNGFLCQVRNAADLAEKMVDMLELSDEERSAFGTASRKYVQSRFDEKLVLAKYLEFLIGEREITNFIDSASLSSAVPETSAS
jgi:glycosyltransferase involved in cell wall biosynthesis